MQALRGLSCREQEIASLVREGMTTKGIALQLCISMKAIDFHRTNIRKKLGAARSAGSLRSLLLERTRSLGFLGAHGGSSGVPFPRLRPRSFLRDPSPAATGEGAMAMDKNDPIFNP